jgi:hypothetical protein
MEISSHITDIVVFVPSGFYAGEHRLSFSVALEWPDVLRGLHEAIGCSREDVLLKPELQWKFQGKNRAKTLQLNDSTHWDDLKSEVRYDRGKKKAQSRIDIIIADKVSSFFFFCYYLLIFYLTSIWRHFEVDSWGMEVSRV